MSDPGRFIRQTPALWVILLAISSAAYSQVSAPPKSTPTRQKRSGPSPPRISLTPRFVAGDSFRYEMEFETTTETSRSGLASDPEGPSSLVVDWNASVRINVLPSEDGTPGGIRLRTTYEKSVASIRSDTFDPAATETAMQYHQLEGKSVEFALDAGGKVQYVSGLEGIVDSAKAAQSAREWIDQLSSSAGAPPGGVSVGQTWSSDQSADSLPIAGLVWHSDSEYLRNESCHPQNPDIPPAPGPTEKAEKSQPVADCAVILTNLSLVHSKSVRDPTPADLRKNGVQSAGKWNGSAQGLVYVSLDTGLVVSVTQTATEEMNVTLTTERNASLHYAGTVSSRSHVALVADDASGK